MHSNRYIVVLDACVLANATLCDVYLRLPPLYLPRWTDKILDETQATHAKLKWPEGISNSWRSAAESAFPEAKVTGFEAMEAGQTNDPKDRHVAAAALRCGAELIVTFNLKHFPKEALAPHGLRAEHPSDYLITLFQLDPAVVTSRLAEIAFRKKQTLENYLPSLERFVPAFVEHVRGAIGLEPSF